MERTAKPARLALTEANLKQLQPSLIRPMPPMSISSGEDDGDANETKEARVARLKSWVYNAMQTLVGLGAEGTKILEADELIIAGPGDVRLRDDSGNDESTLGFGENITRHALPLQTTVRLKRPNLADPAYWEVKLRYLESKCKPLSQAKRKRRRLAPRAVVAADDAERAEAEAKAAEGAGYQRPGQKLEQQTLQELEEAREERERVEQSKLLWLDKRGSIERWIHGLPPIPPPRASSPMTHIPIAAMLNETRASPQPQLSAAHPSYNNVAMAAPPAPASSSSVVEITSTQFSQAVGGRQVRLSEDATTPAPPTTAPMTAAYAGTAAARYNGMTAVETTVREKDSTTTVALRQNQQQQQQQPTTTQPSSPVAVAAAVFSDRSAATAAATETPITSVSPGAGLGAMEEMKTVRDRAGLSPSGVLGKRQRDETAEKEAYC